MQKSCELAASQKFQCLRCRDSKPEVQCYFMEPTDIFQLTGSYLLVKPTIRIDKHENHIQFTLAKFVKFIASNFYLETFLAFL